MSEPQTYDTGSCVIGTRDKPHPAHIGYLCRGHHQQIATWLREIEDEAAMLDPMKSMQLIPDNRGAELASHRAPARLDAIVMRDPRRGTGTPLSGKQDPWGFDDTPSILDVLGSWARLVREERELSAPKWVTVSGERDLLSRQLDWVAEQPWVDEFVAELRELHAALKASNGTSPDKPHCRCPVIVEGKVCRGPVWIHDELQAVWRRHPDRCSRSFEQAPGAAVCATCGSSWTTDGEKARLKRMVDDQAEEDARPLTEDGRRMLTAKELVAEGKTTSESNVRQTAKRAGVVAQRGYYDPRIFDKATA